MTGAAGRSSRPPPGRRQLTYDVRVWTIRTVTGARGRTYQVRWKVAGKIHYATFAKRALAETHEAKLRIAARDGQGFDIISGLPPSMVTEHEPDHANVSWYEFACSYVDMKWHEVAPNSRRSIADTLATATTAMLTTRRGAPEPGQFREALYGWAFNTRLRESGLPPARLTAAVSWIEKNTLPLADLSDPDVLRRVLNQFARKLDGTPAAATVVARKRAVLHNLLGYAVEKEHIPVNPLTTIRWKSPKIAEAVDRRRVVNARQAAVLLDAVARQGPMGRHLDAFFGCIYYAGLRPAEVVMLTRDELDLPDKAGEWGWLYLSDSAPSSGGAWNDTGARRELRQLKHRAAKEVRPVPVSPALADVLRRHLAEYGTSQDGRLFRGEGGGMLSDTIYSRVWDKARRAALTPTEAVSPLAERPYDLRHARLSTWLNAGVAPAQVAEWAGNSVPVLLRVYAKCLTDSEQTALRRIEQAEAQPEP